MEGSVLEEYPRHTTLHRMVAWLKQAHGPPFAQVPILPASSSRPAAHLCSALRMFSDLNCKRVNAQVATPYPPKGNDVLFILLRITSNKEKECYQVNCATNGTIVQENAFSLMPCSAGGGS